MKNEETPGFEPHPTRDANPLDCSAATNALVALNLLIAGDIPVVGKLGNLN